MEGWLATNALMVSAESTLGGQRTDLVNGHNQVTQKDASSPLFSVSKTVWLCCLSDYQIAKE